jgi:hypothetical protein
MPRSDKQGIFGDGQHAQVVGRGRKKRGGGEAYEVETNASFFVAI